MSPQSQEELERATVDRMTVLGEQDGRDLGRS